jgi:hypothetical protein
MCLPSGIGSRARLYDCVASTTGQLVRGPEALRSPERIRKNAGRFSRSVTHTETLARGLNAIGGILEALHPHLEDGARIHARQRVSAPPDEGHLGREHGQKLNVGVERQTGHEEYSLHDVFHGHHRFRLHAAIRL